MYEKELRDELTKMWDDPDFASGALCYLDTDEQRKQVLNGVRAGTLNNPTKVFNTVMEIAGFATTCDEG
jgi:hypothetical protein